MQMFRRLGLFQTIVGILGCVGADKGVQSDNWDPRVAELNQIGGNYELIDVTFDSQSNKISFDAYGNTYGLSLTVNEDLVFANIKHMVNDDEHHPDLQLSSLKDLKESCHYQIELDNNGGKFSGAISICPGKGVRGVIDTENDTLIITPSKRLLDLEYDSDPTKKHDITHKHLIYFMSNFDNTGFENAIKMEEKRYKEKIYSRRGYNSNPAENGKTKKDKTDNLADDVDLPVRIPHTKSRLQSESQSRRKLLATNYCEFLAMADPDWYYTYYSNYGNNYYDELVSEISNVVNYMSGKFSQTNWGSTVGTIQVKFVAILVMKQFSGNYASLQPSPSGNSNSYLSKLVTWSKSYYPSGYSTSYSRSYDAIQIFVGASNFDTGGLAWLSSICKTNGYNTGLTGIRNGNYMYPTSEIGHIATHELGHNFGCEHDQNTACGNNGGLMGYGTNKNIFSSCSINFVKQFFQQYSTSCLETGVRGFENDPNEGGGTNPNPTPRPTPKPTTNNGGGSSCITINNLDYVSGYNFNTVFTYQSTYSNQPYYSATISGKTFYMYYSSGWAGYNIYTSFQQYTAYAYVSGTDPTSGSWEINNNGWSNDNNAYATTSCNSGGSNPNPTSKPTAKPTNNDYGGGDLCGGYYCVGVYNLDLSQYNKQYINQQYCHNGKAVYARSGYYLYWNSYFDDWSLYTSVSDNWVHTGCSENNVMDCGGKWWLYQNSWSQDSNGGMYQCSSGKSDGSDTDSDIIDTTLNNNCTNTYGTNVCIYNDGTLWDNGIATFTYQGCYNNIPFFEYTSYPSSLNDSYGAINYYLHYSNMDNIWMISITSFESEDGVATCNQTDLTLCTYNEWTIQVPDGDSIGFELSDSMGYDSICVIEDNDNLGYCQTDGSCSLWQFKVLISDPTYTLDMCDSSIVDKECLDAHFISDYTKDINSNYICQSNFELTINYNISFTNENGYSVYNDYLNNYISNVENCLGSPQDTDTLEIKMVYSHLKTCGNCKNFVPSSDESGAVAGIYVISVYNGLLAITVCLLVGILHF